MSVGAEGTPAAPGTGETPGTPTGTPAEAQNTGTPQDGSTPETIPYSRFKEVNDAYRPYKELEGIGYDADSLHRLAGFEAAYIQDPYSVLGELVDGLADLPDDTKALLKEHLTPQGNADPPAGQNRDEQTPADEPPEWAKPLLQDYTERQSASEAKAQSDQLDEVIRLWDEADAKDEVETPMNTKLAYIAINGPHFQSVEEIASAARADAMGYRQHVLGGTRTTLRDSLASGSPHPVPGGGGVTPAPSVTPKTIAEATAAARAAIEAGTLPTPGR